MTITFRYFQLNLAQLIGRIIAHIWKKVDENHRNLPENDTVSKTTKIMLFRQIMFLYRCCCFGFYCTNGTVAPRSNPRLFGNTTVRESTHKKYRQRMIASELRLDTGSDCVRWAGWNGRKIDSHTIRTSMCTQCAVSVCVVVCFLFGVFVARFIVKAVRSSVCFSMYLMRNDKEITRSSQWIRIINVKTTIIYHHIHYICDRHTS